MENENENKAAETAAGVSLECPLCGKEMPEGQWSWRCECGFKASKELFGAKFGAEQMKLIFAGNSPEFNLVSKAGNIYKSKVRVDAEHKNLALGTDTGIACPLCGKKIIEGSFDYECSARCGFKTNKKFCGVEISREILKAAIEGKSEKMNFMSAEKHKDFDGYLVVNKKEGRLGVSFDDPSKTENAEPEA